MSSWKLSFSICEGRQRALLGTEWLVKCVMGLLENRLEKNNSPRYSSELELCGWHSLSWHAFIKHLLCDKPITDVTEKTSSRSIHVQGGHSLHTNQVL